MFTYITFTFILLIIIKKYVSPQKQSHKYTYTYSSLLPLCLCVDQKRGERSAHCWCAGQPHAGPYLRWRCHFLCAPAGADAGHSRRTAPGPAPWQQGVSCTQLQQGTCAHTQYTTTKIYTDNTQFTQFSII